MPQTTPSLPINALTSHPHLKLSLLPAKPVYVASPGNKIDGVLEVRCEKGNGMWIGEIGVELRGVEELKSLDHSATRTFHTSQIRFQGSNLPPSNAVRPIQSPISGTYYPALKGRTRFEFGFRVPEGKLVEREEIISGGGGRGRKGKGRDGDYGENEEGDDDGWEFRPSPGTFTLGGNASVRWEIRATAQILSGVKVNEKGEIPIGVEGNRGGERSLVTQRVEIFSVEDWGWNNNVNGIIPEWKKSIYWDKEEGREIRGNRGDQVEVRCSTEKKLFFRSVGGGNGLVNGIGTVDDGGGAGEGGDGEVGMHGAVEVLVRVRNVSKKTIYGVTLSLGRKLIMPTIKADTSSSSPDPYSKPTNNNNPSIPPPPSISETVVTQTFRGSDYEFPPVSPGAPLNEQWKETICKVELPRVGMKLKGGIGTATGVGQREGELWTVRGTRLFEIGCFVAAEVGGGAFSKAMIVELPISIAHPLSLPPEAHRYTPHHRGRPLPSPTDPYRQQHHIPHPGHHGAHPSSLHPHHPHLPRHSSVPSFQQFTAQQQQPPPPPGQPQPLSFQNPYGGASPYLPSPTPAPHIQHSPPSMHSYTPNPSFTDPRMGNNPYTPAPTPFQRPPSTQPGFPPYGYAPPATPQPHHQVNPYFPPPTPAPAAPPTPAPPPLSNPYFPPQSHLPPDQQHQHHQQSSQQQHPNYIAFDPNAATLTHSRLLGAIRQEQQHYGYGQSSGIQDPYAAISQHLAGSLPPRPSSSMGLANPAPSGQHPFLEGSSSPSGIPGGSGQYYQQHPSPTQGDIPARPSSVRGNRDSESRAAAGLNYPSLPHSSPTERDQIVRNLQAMPPYSGVQRANASTTAAAANTPEEVRKALELRDRRRNSADSAAGSSASSSEQQQRQQISSTGVGGSPSPVPSPGDVTPNLTEQPPQLASHSQPLMDHLGQGQTPSVHHQDPSPPPRTRSRSITTPTPPPAPSSRYSSIGSPGLDSAFTVSTQPMPSSPPVPANEYDAALETIGEDGESQVGTVKSIKGVDFSNPDREGVGATPTTSSLQQLEEMIYQEEEEEEQRRSLIMKDIVIDVNEKTLPPVPVPTKQKKRNSVERPTAMELFSTPPEEELNVSSSSKAPERVGGPSASKTVPSAVIPPKLSSTNRATSTPAATENHQPHSLPPRLATHRSEGLLSLETRLARPSSPDPPFASAPVKGSQNLIRNEGHSETRATDFGPIRSRSPSRMGVGGALRAKSSSISLRAAAQHAPLEQVFQSASPVVPVKDSSSKVSKESRADAVSFPVAGRSSAKPSESRSSHTAVEPIVLPLPPKMPNPPGPPSPPSPRSPTEEGSKPGRKVLDVQEVNQLKEQAVGRISDWLKTAEDAPRDPPVSLARHSRTDRRKSFDVTGFGNGRPSAVAEDAPTGAAIHSTARRVTPTDRRKSFDVSGLMQRKEKDTVKNNKPSEVHVFGNIAPSAPASSSPAPPHPIVPAPIPTAARNKKIDQARSSTPTGRKPSELAPLADGARPPSRSADSFSKAFSTRPSSTSGRPMSPLVPDHYEANKVPAPATSASASASVSRPFPRPNSSSGVSTTSVADANRNRTPSKARDPPSPVFDPEAVKDSLDEIRQRRESRASHRTMSPSPALASTTARKHGDSGSVSGKVAGAVLSSSPPGGERIRKTASFTSPVPVVPLSTGRLNGQAQHRNVSPPPVRGEREKPKEMEKEILKARFDEDRQNSNDDRTGRMDFKKLGAGLDISDIQAKYDVKSARGGRGGVVTDIAGMWAGRIGDKPAEKDKIIEKSRDRVGKLPDLFTPPPLSSPSTGPASPPATAPIPTTSNRSRSPLGRTDVHRSRSPPSLSGRYHDKKHSLQDISKVSHPLDSNFSTPHNTNDRIRSPPPPLSQAQRGIPTRLKRFSEPPAPIQAPTAISPPTTTLGFVTPSTSYSSATSAAISTATSIKDAPHGSSNTNNKTDALPAFLNTTMGKGIPSHKASNGAVMSIGATSFLEGKGASAASRAHAHSNSASSAMGGGLLGGGGGRKSEGAVGLLVGNRDAGAAANAGGEGQAKLKDLIQRYKEAAASTS